MKYITAIGSCARALIRIHIAMGVEYILSNNVSTYIDVIVYKYYICMLELVCYC